MHYDSHDLEVINNVLRFYPQLTELIDTVKSLSQKISYPIHSFYELLDTLDADHPGTVPGTLGSLGSFPRSIPAYYFPIASQVDLIAKLLDLRMASHSPAPVRFAAAVPPSSWSSEVGRSPMAPPALIAPPPAGDPPASARSSPVAPPPDASGRA
jgi:hypothetical protein